MLYIFQVDTGTMLTFDMNLALDSVTTLQTTIATTHSIPISCQVLIISGGTPLPPDSRVCSYPAGTDTNPIFLFNKLNIEGNTSAFPWQPVGVPDKLLEVEGGAVSILLLSKMAERAGGIFEVSKEILEKSEGLVHDQHLQHLGWSAVVANLSDIISVFEKRVKKFESDISKEFDGGGLELDVVEGLPATIAHLATIPIPPELGCHGNLLEWLETSCVGNSIVSLPGQYGKVVELLDRGVVEGVVKDSLSLLTKSTTTPTEIGGLSNRLYTLDQLLTTSKTLLKEQSQLSTAIQTTTNRATSDLSILPDLCESHSRQLSLMVENLLKIQDINKRCLKAKEELINNLLARLKWVVYIQKSINEVNLKLSVYSENLKKFRNMKLIIKQVANCEQVFSSCLAELKRRNTFEKLYNEQLQIYKQKFTKIFDQEKSSRKTFTSKFSQHFLFNTLFEDLALDNVPSDFSGGFDDVGRNCALLDDNNEPLFDGEMDVTMEHEKELKELEERHRKEVLELGESYEKEIWDLKAKFRNEIEAVKARVRFVTKQQRELVAEETVVNHAEEIMEEEQGVPGGVHLLCKKLSLSPTGPPKIGDPVLIFYHETYEAFLVYANNSSSSVHFIHTDCSRELKKEKCYLGNVVDKEYCVARRAQNRYKVPQGFHFYRVKISVKENYSL